MAETEGDVPAGPSWVPGGPVVSRWDETTNEVELDIRSSPLELGHVPAGASITVTSRSVSGLVVRAESVGEGAVLRSRRAVSLDLPQQHGFRRVELAGSSHEKRCTLGGEDVVVRLLDKGSFAVDGQPYRLEVAPGSHRCTLRGDAQIASLASEVDQLVVDADIAPGAVLTIAGGHAEFRRALDGVDLNAGDAKVTVKGALVGGKAVVLSLTADSLQGADVTVTGDVRVHDEINGGTTLTLTDEATGPCVVWPSGPTVPLEFTDDPSKHVPTRAVSPGRGGAVRDSTITTRGRATVIMATCSGSRIAGGSAVRVDGVASTSSIRAADDVVVGDAQLGEEDVLEASCIRVGSLSGGRVESTWAWCDGVVGGAHIEAENVEVQGALERSTVVARGSLRVNGTCESGTTLELGGSAELGDVCEAKIQWTPSGSSMITAAGLACEIVVEGASHARLEVTKAPARLISLEVDGDLAVMAHKEVAKGRKAEETNFDIETAEVRDGGTLALLRGGLRVSLERVTLGTGACLDSHVGGVAVITVGKDARVVSQATALRLVPMDQSRPLAGLTLAGTGRLDLDGSFFNVTCEGNAEGGPILAVPENARVERVSGDLRLGEVRGVLAGRVGRPGSWRAPSRRADESTRSPRIWRILPQGSESSGDAVDGGRVVFIDPTPCDYTSLGNASDFRVFEPDQRALIDFATRGEDDPHRRRDDAYKAQAISDMVASSAASGGAKSAARWAAARTHHRALSDAPVEESLRRIHRLLGYGQRPIQPLLAYLVAVAVWTGVEWRFDRYPEAEGFGAFVQTVARMAVVPASFVARLPSETDFHYVLDEPGWHALAFITIGLPLVFFVLALRNFMAAPDAAK